MKLKISKVKLFQNRGMNKWNRGVDKQMRELYPTKSQGIVFSSSHDPKYIYDHPPILKFKLIFQPEQAF